MTHLMSGMAVGFVPKDMARAQHANPEMPSGEHFGHLIMFTVPPCSWKGEEQLLKLITRVLNPPDTVLIVITPMSCLVELF